MKARHAIRFAALVLAWGVAPATAFAAEATSPADAIRQGKFSVNARLRYEGVQQTNLSDANALTLRTRLGFTTARFSGWQFSAEGGNVAAFDGDAYSQAGLNPAAARRAVVADPETTELNQLWLAYTHDQTTGTLGRQKLVLDHARFIGDVGWRQNQQTFDAFLIQDKSLRQTTLTYAYLDQINRVFSRRHAQGRWESDSHLFHASHAGLPAGTLTAYAYLLSFANSAANSSATYGASFAGARPLTDAVKFTYRADLATQNDYRNNPRDYSAIYNCFEAGLALKSASLTLGHELLGSDANIGFKTPLATLHAFNGWADLFLATPPAGLRDVYLRATANLPRGLALTAFHHWFEAARGGADYGTEFDAMLSRKFGKYFTATAKFADFRRDSPAFPNVRKVWLQLEFAR